MEFSRADAERALESVPLFDDVAREVVDERILESLAGRRFAPFATGNVFPAEFEYLAERERQFVTRSTPLTYAVLAELQSGEFEIESRPFWRGFGASLEFLIARFGAVGMIETVRSPWPEFGVAVNFPRLIDDAELDEFFYEDRYSALRFPRLGLRLPLAVVPGTTVLHAPPNPFHSTATCYATRDGIEGVVVAGHSVQLCGYGDPVLMDNGGTGWFMASGYRPIDAAFLAIDRVPRNLAPLPVIDFPTTGEEVLVHTRDGAQRRSVAQVNNSMVGPHFSDYPIVLYLDQACQSGDSGALVQIALTGEAVGIYTGAHAPRDPSPTGALGTAQNFAQAIFTLGVDPIQ